ncbi:MULTISPECIES: PLP-dependent aminotransferase family protein [Methylosinus]|uniref:PLP-dependent aminotransferase family protein n=1 Tax=Methylosinus trichosporium (strain ATCC 35070 / NCIMB 11131 / UNIQEM 75 / OB3b) TaxID=595536 RepID=A0A2D2CUW3_METT3|nr:MULTISPECIES: PLP-dependent aminotransferase family protein [Methylosinus]ATQ66497.1 PLP-dependent aminotransferase family protein [Methylosinus trichosporium OB3b]OBS52663.1 GntR family transcriptional regulator [Methylosinus sp. 3S-1]
MLRPWTFQLTERIDARRGAPLYLQIVHALIHEIERGRLVPGAPLPSSRELAASLGVNRKTIVLAYDDLVAQGWFSTDRTRGTFVSAQLPETKPGKAARTDMRCAEFDFRAPPEPRLVFAGQDRVVIDDGLPDPRLFSVETLLHAHREAGRRAARSGGLGYGDPRGALELRRMISEMLATHRGIVVGEDEICVTRGSQMGIFLAARILLSPGDAVLVEGLSYASARDAFAAAGAEVIGVGLDAEGLNVDDVERECARRNVRAVYVTPHHQFPTTVSLTPERRLKLLQIAAKHRFAIIEDDYDHEFHFERQPLLPMASYAPGRTIYVGSMSKLLLPGLRVGYIAAPQEVARAIANVAATIDRQGNALTELAVAELIRSGELRRHVRKARQIYARRRDAFGASLRRVFGARVDYSVPDGGLAYWATFPDAATLDALEASAADNGVRMLPSTSFAAPQQTGRGLRLGFGSLDEAEAARALSRLAGALGEESAGRAELDEAAARRHI